MSRVVIVGAGFAGLWAARTLAAAGADATLVDRNNYHTFLPLLYQVAAAEVEPEHIAYPARGIFRRRRGIRFVMAEVRGADLDRRVLFTDGPALAYDHLLLAPGSVPRFHGIPGADAHCFQLKELEQGIELRNHILTCFERAAVTPEAKTRTRLLTFVIIGGGPTGVEYAGALAELVRGPLAKDFPDLDPGAARVVLLEATDGLLPGYPEKLGRYAARRLRRIGVEVRLGAAVTRVDPDGIELAGAPRLATETVVWSAGVRGHPLAGALGLPVTPDGRVEVLPTLQVPGRLEVFVAGDLCGWKGPDGRPLPLVAPAAVQQGRAAAANILRLARGETPVPFRYRDKGAMAVVGRGAAVVRIGRWAIAGLPAWLLWLFVHILYLVGFRNRLAVLLDWTQDYLFLDRAVRLILPRRPQAEKRSGGRRSGT
ncbi:NAD(P)/FAD-dependent oxidoreductase [Dissulfurirhabdus thermomarina]|uniref:NADH:ubiquinone reductase (non-electrogenic) n=1 Tax=Dissulfurirhabdus thermomarina TaxID=1765737 RepID=A0A6N9TUD6_DISTH|nr:NAD(P)/FAD-dependent oxidoreductase [Dissulfurirhabdus thermomarina]NDY42116.1 NAD(P)/FAD-dependent oxidoreductase [Dissulfurirhabdus thermomarina]NMX22862.1 NAD(P)/FAD-dependent oxidoreductase [Dissulfurirhabdus thermomarina]